MAVRTSQHSTDFDSIVIGSSLGGLIAARYLQETGRKVALVEGLDTLGGSSRPFLSKAGPIDHGLKLIADNSESREILQWLSDVLDERIVLDVVEAPVVTFDEGRFKPFVGFGDRKVQTAHEVDAYARERYLRTYSTSKDWVQRLSGLFSGALFTQSYATKIIVENDLASEIIINGAKKLSCREIFFCANPQQLTKLLPESHVPARLRQKLLKGELWTSLNLDFVHGAPVTDSAAVHILKGANEEPCFGVFHPPTSIEGRTIQVSQWSTLVPHDQTDDDESAAAALKQIKRQLKRAYEKSVEGLIQERVIVNPCSHGDLSGVLPPDGHWPSIQNLWAISGLFDTVRNLTGTLRQAQRSLTAISKTERCSQLAPAEPVSSDTRA